MKHIKITQILFLLGQDKVELQCIKLINEYKNFS
jgi:hypothetical protein